MVSESYVIPGIPEVIVERDIKLTMPDGVELASDVYRPLNANSELPVILIRIPYDKRQAENIGYAHPSWYARHGYIVVCQDNRGRYRSGGDWYPFENETSDGVAAIEWAAALPGSNGKVGMYGFSYGGATQLLPATTSPEALQAICPAFTGSQYYEGWTYQQGAFSLAFAASWALSLGIHNAARRGDDAAAAQLAAAFAGAMGWHWSLPVEHYQPLLGDDTRYFFDWLDHPTYDDYWRRWSIDDRYAQIDVPGLHIGGWYDVFLRGTIRNFQGLQREAKSERSRTLQKLVIGPWYHMPWMPQGPNATAPSGGQIIDDLQLQWFDHILKGEATAITDAPVTVWINGEENWRDFADWPPPDHRPTKWFLHSGGRANSRYGDGQLTVEPPEHELPDIFTYDPMNPVVGTGGHSCCFPFVAPMGPMDQAGSEQTNGVLVYTSPVFETNTTFAGSVELVLYASTDAVDTDWAARLCLVDEEELSTNLLEGIVRGQFRESLTNPALLVPNHVYEYRIDLGAIGLQVKRGQRLRLDLASSDFPQWARNLNTGNLRFDEGLSSACVATQVVLHDADHPSHVVLPLLE